MRVLIPAGGQGTRLRPLTLRIPKPLLPLGPEPILTRILELLPPGVPAVPIITTSLVAPFRRWREGLPPGLPVELFVEEPEAEARGPVAGLLQYLRAAAPGEDVVIVMGDSVLPFPLESFLPAPGQGATRPRLAAYLLPEEEDPSRFGVLEIGEDGCVARFQEKPAAPRSRWVFTGALFLPARLLTVLSAQDAARMPQMGDLVSLLLALGEAVEVFQAQGEWHDVGTFHSYLAAHRPLMDPALRERLTRAGCRMEGTVYVHPAAVAEGSLLRDTIVWEGARITDSSLTECIVQEGVRVHAETHCARLLTADEPEPVRA